jgi:hypothetical protein
LIVQKFQIKTAYILSCKDNKTKNPMQCEKKLNNVIELLYLPENGCKGQEDHYLFAPHFDHLVSFTKQKKNNYLL